MILINTLFGLCVDCIEKYRAAFNKAKDLLRLNKHDDAVSIIFYSIPNIDLTSAEMIVRDLKR